MRPLTEKQRLAFVLLEDAARHFVSKVDKGLAHSVESYSAFKAALEVLDGE
jgi:hypothetical protein